jgi:hypothetical protein
MEGFSYIDGYALERCPDILMLEASTLGSCAATACSSVVLLSPLLDFVSFLAWSQYYFCLNLA